VLNNNTYKISKPPESWGGIQSKSVTFVVTENCQLACKYCYLVGKNSKNKMSFEVAKKTIDYLLDHKSLFPSPSVIFDFIGGEPFLEIQLIDKICDYFKISAFEKDHPWFESYRFSFSTNGILYDSPEVQKYIEKNRMHLSIGISIDGTKRKHDLQRIYPNGKGSYNDVIKNIPLWISQFPDASTKVTISRDDIPYIKESVLHLWELGIKSVNINVVFEDVWKEGDDEKFEQQLMELGDYIIEHKLYENHHCSFFSENIGKPNFDNQNWCGAGKMLAVDYQGNFYPCVRFTPFSMENKQAIVTGNCYEGINLNKLRPFLTLDKKTQSTEECINCEVATGCAWCQGANYDFADNETIYQRSTCICKMHKARVRANKYFWNKLENVNNLVNEKV